ncbi:MAG: DUF21 domain-containing protein, partial [Desulfobacteraceae bacterium]|nr:DUF21 domain-containing protein [Desulfobacteraceae bacterium]
MTFEIFITLFLVFLNGFFVASEFAIVKVRYSQIEIRAIAGDKVAETSKNILNHLDSYLSATQLGITLASLGLGWTGEPVVAKIIVSIFHALNIPLSSELTHKIALPVAFVTITVLHIVFGELVPKSIAIRKPEPTTLLLSVPLKIFFVIFKPF